MPILSQITSGISTAGQRIVIAANEKMGKTTLVSGAPNVLLVPLENGFATMRCNRTPQLETFGAVMELCQELEQASQRGQLARGSTIAWDSATALERLIHDYTIQSDPTFKHKNKTALTMESALGGYGKAYQYANEQFSNFLASMDRLSLYGGINIVLTCHVFASRVVDPLHGEYDCWDLLLHSPKNQKTYGKREILTQWADLIGFLHEPIFVMKAEEGSKMNRVISANQGRLLAVDRTPQYVAGNRYGLTGVIPIPKEQGWNYVADAIYKQCGIDLYNREA